MNVLHLVWTQPWIERLGWTLVHFLWQGVLIAMLYAAVRSCVGAASSPNIRYVCACVTLAVMIAVPFVTFGVIGLSELPQPVARLALAAPSAPGTGAPAQLTSTSLQNVPSRQQSLLTWVVMLWTTGAALFFMRLIGGWATALGIRSAGVRPAPPEWQLTLEKLAMRIRLTRPVRLLISIRVQSPTVIGWLRPVVLMPIGSLAGLPSEQVEALLVHELAHIRRHDYLVNILQSITEALLFYHPAVWWVSGHIRTERELCCDDVAVSISGDALTYARALTELESYRWAHVNGRLAANGSPLEHRIHRLLGESRPFSCSRPAPVIILSAILVMIAAYGMFGQSPAPPRFEIASIKPNSTRASDTVALNDVRNPGFANVLSDGRLLAGWIVPHTLIQEAYGLQPYQVTGGPEWMKSDHYDIEAKAAGNASRQQMMLMLRSLLEDKFKLKVHRETQILPSYALTQANGGLKVQPSSEASCWRRGSPWPPPPPPAGLRQSWLTWPAPLPCGRAQVSVVSLSEAHLRAGDVSMAELTRDLSKILGHTVIDKTGFTGRFDLHTVFTPDEALAGVRDSWDQRLPSDATGGSLFTAIQEQVGLKLESGRSPVEVLVIDSVERPSEN